MPKKKQSSAPKWTRIIAIILVIGLVVSSLVAIGASQIPSSNSGVTVTDITTVDGSDVTVEQIDLSDETTSDDVEDTNAEESTETPTDTQPAE